MEKMIKIITFDLGGVYFPNGKVNFISALEKLGVSEDEAKRLFLTSSEMNQEYKNGKMTDYHCGRSLNYECDEPYITGADLIKQLITNIDKIKFNNSGVSRKIQEDIERYHRLKSQVLHQEYIDGHLGEFERIPKTSADKNQMTKKYLLHILQVGTAEERQEALTFIKTKFILTNKTIVIQKIPIS